MLTFFKVLFLSLLLLAPPTLTLASVNPIDNAANSFFCRTFCTSFGCKCREVLEMCKQCEPLGKHVSGCFKIEEKQTKWCFISAVKLLEAGYKGTAGAVGGYLSGTSIGAMVSSFVFSIFGISFSIPTFGGNLATPAVVGSIIGGASAAIAGALVGVVSGANSGEEKGKKFSKVLTGVIGKTCSTLKLGDQKPPTNLMGMFCTMIRVARASQDSKIQPKINTVETAP